MLTVHMPDGHKSRRRKNRPRALAYALAGILIFAAGLVSYRSNWWYLVAAVEAWWLWACVTGIDW